MSNEIIYLDANSMTFMSEDVIKFMNKWTNKGHPDGDYQSAKDCKKLIKSFKEQILLEVLGDEQKNDFNVSIFNSASEANVTFIRNCVQSYAAITKTLPHIIISDIEHKSITNVCKELVECGLCQLDIAGLARQTLGDDLAGLARQTIGDGLAGLARQTLGDGLTVGLTTGLARQTLGDGLENKSIENKILKLIRPNTCLISISATNSLSGEIYNLKSISIIAKQKNIPFHSDVVQIFSRSVFHLVVNGLDSCTANFYKMHGPTGIGILVTSNKLIEGYKLKLNNYSIPNIPAIAGALFAYRTMLEKRAEKNTNLLKLKKIFIETINDFIQSKKTKTQIIWLSDIENYMENTILFSLDNLNTKETLISEFEKHNIIVFIVSKKENIVLFRISFTDNTTLEEIKKVIKIIAAGIGRRLLG